MHDSLLHVHSTEMRGRLSPAKGSEPRAQYPMLARDIYILDVAVGHVDIRDFVTLLWPHMSRSLESDGTCNIHVRW